MHSLQKQKKNNHILKIAFIFERVLAVVVLIAVFLGTIDVLRLMWGAYIVDFQNPVQYSQLNDFLAQILLLVIGVELVVMLSLHIPGAFIEALLYAIARKMLLLPKNEGMIDVLIGVIAIAGLFAIKKFLVTKDKSALNIMSIHDEEAIKEQQNKEDEDKSI
ncbi:phosphate-starvation-inducible PsiE family protein [Clostridioides difficile]|nr:phosphate-starvation-inducible PsiE family protein [Clostridioides difficile]